jgi:acyl carrier protein
MRNNKILLSEIQKIFNKVFKSRFIINEKTKKNNILEWDSLGTVNLIIELEKFYKIKISPDKALKIDSVSKIINFLKKKKLDVKKINR